MLSIIVSIKAKRFYLYYFIFRQWQCTAVCFGHGFGNNESHDTILWYTHQCVWCYQSWSMSNLSLLPFLLFSSVGLLQIGFRMGRASKKNKMYAERILQTSKASRLWSARRGLTIIESIWKSGNLLIHMAKIPSKLEVFDFSGGQKPPIRGAFSNWKKLKLWESALFSG